MSGKWFKPVSLHACAATTSASTWTRSQALAHEHKPKMIIAGGSAYPRHIDFAAFREIADEVGAYLHGRHGPLRRPRRRRRCIPSPFPHAHVVTTTTHKTLRGPRGGMILTNDEAIAKKINSAIFPGIQGGPLMHVIAAKAVAFGEALTPEFKVYAKQRDRERQGAGRDAASTAASRIVSGGTDNHLMLVDLRPKGLTGKAAEKRARARRTSPATRTACRSTRRSRWSPRASASAPRPAPRAASASPSSSEIGGLIVEVLDGLVAKGEDGNAAVEASVKSRVHALTDRFPIYG